MASVEKRGKSFRAVVRLPDGGKSYATRDTEPEAWAWAKQEESRLRMEALLEKSVEKVTCEEMFLAYEEAVASKTDSAKWNKLRLAKFCLSPLSPLLVSEVKTHDINLWIAARSKDLHHGNTISGSTVNRELNLMSGAFQYAVDDREWIDVNPCHGARRVASARPRKRPLLSPAEVKAITTATGYDRDPVLKTKTARVGACFLLAMETGMRSGEILRAKPIDYRKDDLILHVAAREKGGRKASKSGMSQLDPSRDVPLTARAMELLDQLMKSMPADQPYIVGLTDESRDALWRKAVGQAGVEDVHFHDMKHEAATRLSPFLDVLALSHAIGTKDVKLLRDTYYNKDATRSAKLLPASLVS